MENLFKDTGSNSFRNGPDDRGRFGDYGGRFVSETLMPLIIELEGSYQELRKDDNFWEEYEELLNNYVVKFFYIFYLFLLENNILIGCISNGRADGKDD